MKILVTDDSKLARKMVIKTLHETITNQEFEIIEGENGAQAIELYKKNSPKIVFLDLTMPEVNGFEALKEIKNFDNNAKVIIVSADIQKLSIEKAKELGAFNFIKKPIDSTKMKQIINKLIEAK